MNIENVLTVGHFRSGEKRHWLPHIEDQFSLPYILHLRAFLRLEREASESDRNCSIYPEPDKVFQALELTSPCRVRVVILGQDPYYDGQADGLAFSMGNLAGGCGINTSLKQIFTAVNRDCSANIPLDGSIHDLQSWATQGVLLLNCVLSVRHECPKSHFCHGWEKFTDKIIDTIISDQDHVVFMLWGREAEKKFDECVDLSIRENHCVLRAPHPAARWEKREEFVQAGHFAAANGYLSCHEKGEIDWLSVINQT